MACLKTSLLRPSLGQDKEKSFILSEGQIRKNIF